MGGCIYDVCVGELVGRWTHILVILQFELRK